MAHPRVAFPLILLAAGSASRMRGADKLLELVDGVPLVRRQAEMALEVSAHAIVALPPAPHPRYDALDGLDVTRLPVADANEGMGASLRRAFSALPKGTQAGMLVLCDMPDLTAADLMKVADAVDLDSETLIWRGATEDGLPGHPIVFAAALFGALTSLAGDSGGREVVAQAGENVALIALPQDRARLDLDTPEAWTAWRARQKTTP